MILFAVIPIHIVIAIVTIVAVIAALLGRLIMAMAIRTLAGFLFVDQAHDAVIMFRVLKIVLSRDTVAGSMRIARQGLILFMNLKSIATDANIRPVAVIILVALRSALTAIAAPVATISTTAAATAIIVAAAAA